eukprot:241678_1
MISIALRVVVIHSALWPLLNITNTFHYLYTSTCATITQYHFFLTYQTTTKAKVFRSQRRLCGICIVVLTTWYNVLCFLMLCFAYYSLITARVMTSCLSCVAKAILLCGISFCSLHSF